MEGFLIKHNVKNIIKKQCPDENSLCSITFKIGETFQSFNDVVELFKTRGFIIQEFVDDLMCVLSREKDGLNEAIKIKQNLVQIQAWKATITELCADLSQYCKDII